MSAAFIQTPVVRPSENTLSPPTSAASTSLPSVSEEAVGEHGEPIRNVSATKPGVRFGNADTSKSPSVTSLPGSPNVGIAKRRTSVIGLNTVGRRASISPATGSGNPMSGMMRRRHSMWGSLTKRFTLPAGGMLREGTAEERRRSETPPKHENTYRLSPSDDERFKGSKVEEEVTKLLQEELEDVKYSNPMEISFLSKDICDKIKNRVKELGFSRHKLVVYMVMGSIHGQGMEIASRGMWDANHDSYVSAKFQNGSLFAVAMINALYYE